MNRLGRGYSFEALRAKILFTEGAHKRTLSPPKFERRGGPERKVAEPAMIGYALADGVMPFGKSIPMPRRGGRADGHPHEPPGPPKNYGADIATLIQLLESWRVGARRKLTTSAR